jgi:hypothetical protein
MATPNEPRTEHDDPPEPTGTSATIDDVEVVEAPDQWPTPDLTGLDEEAP